ncbi:MAG: MoxR family ATPase [Phycisphaerae bacterium]|nr:MoxR family ATPase [Phycisphaerae bacterium]
MSENEVKDETSAATTPDDSAAVERLREAYANMRAEIGKVIIGQEQVLEETLVAIFARGHCLLEGVPGLAKTLLIHTLSEVMSLSFKRIQFTPDLMPSDIIGTDILQHDRASGERQFVFVKGPIFANIVLADEINRTPPKTQAALLEAMQEHNVTASGQEFNLSEPFFVLATQNPIEQEGTYPLPEAQLDRFMFKIKVDYPSFDEEMDIVRATTVAKAPELKKVLGVEEILYLQDLVRRVPVPEHVYKYAVTMSRMTRTKGDDVPQYIRDWVAWGAGVRASQYLTLGAKARAILHGRSYASLEDIRAVAPPVLRHRILTNFNAEAEGISTDDIIERLLEDVPRFTEEEGGQA